VLVYYNGFRCSNVVVKFALVTVQTSGNRTTRRQTNSRSVKSRTGQLAD